MQPKLAMYDGIDQTLIEASWENQRGLISLSSRRRSAKLLDLIVEQEITSKSFSRDSYMSRLGALFDLYYKAERLGQRNKAAYIAMGVITIEPAKKRFFHIKPRERFTSVLRLYRKP